MSVSAAVDGGSGSDSNSASGSTATSRAPPAQRHGARGLPGSSPCIASETSIASAREGGLWRRRGLFDTLNSSALLASCMGTSPLCRYWLFSRQRLHQLVGAFVEHQVGLHRVGGPPAHAELLLGFRKQSADVSGRRAFRANETRCLVQ